MANNDRWEHGSFLQWLSPEEHSETSHPWGDESVLCGSGRDAFRTILEYAMQTRGWKRLYVPCYYCQEVVESLVSTGIEVKLYPNGPEDPVPHPASLGLGAGDVLLRVSFFGLQGSLQSGEADSNAAEIIDDFSHDPWSYGAWHSDADFCVVSLRKTLPLPDGGVLWSPKGHPLPQQPRLTERHRLISLEKLAAMVLKSEYLAGKPVPKDTFRRLAVSSEENLSQGRASGMPEWTVALIDSLPVTPWRDQRRLNHQAFSKAVSEIPWLRVLQVADESQSCPFSAVMVIETEDIRNRIRTELISRRIYPTTLWPLDEPIIAGIPPQYIDFSHRMLSIQCDARYTPEEMLHVAEIIRQFDSSGSPARTRASSPAPSLRIRKTREHTEIS